MTDTDRGMDPRYDARFQRGYDAARDRDAPPPIGDAGPTELPEMEEERARPTGVAAPLASHEREHVPSADPAPDSDPEPSAGPEDALAPAAAAPRPVERDRHPDPRAAARVRGRLVAGWAVTGGALLLGVWLTWSVNSDFSYYGGVVDQASENLRVLGWALAPALLLTGAVGAVVVTAVAAHLHDDGRSAPSDGPSRFRRAPAWWALLAIAVGAVVLIAWAVAIAAEGNRVGSTLQFSPDGNVSDDQQALLDTMALGQVAQVLIAPIASAAIAALVAVSVIEAMRAARPALR